jgi:hypothetical protein
MRGSYRKKSLRELPQVYCPPMSAEVIRLITRQNALDPRLAPTDRHMQRWAAGQGTGLPNPDRALIVRATMTPLPTIDAIVTDKVVLDSPRYWRRFIVLWYRSDCSVDQMAEDMQLSRDKVFIERRLVLAYLLGRLTALGILIPTFEPYA